MITCCKLHPTEWTLLMSLLFHVSYVLKSRCRRKVCPRKQKRKQAYNCVLRQPLSFTCPECWAATRLKTEVPDSLWLQQTFRITTQLLKHPHWGRSNLSPATQHSLKIYLDGCLSISQSTHSTLPPPPAPFKLVINVLPQSSHYIFMTFTPHELQPIYLESNWQRVHVIQYDSSQCNQPVPRWSSASRMSRWISEQCEVLAGVVELVLLLTIAKEKIALSVLISSAANMWVCRKHALYSGPVFARLSLDLSVYMPCRWGHICYIRLLPPVWWPTYRGPQWVSTQTLLVCVFVTHTHTHIQQCVLYMHAESLCVSLQMLSCVLAAVFASLEFSKKLVCCFGLQLFKFLRQSFSLSGEQK